MVGAGLFNLFVLFGAIGEPATTGLLQMVEDVSQGFLGGVGAGLFKLFVLFGAIGEPAPTGLFKMVRNVRKSGHFLLSSLFIFSPRRRTLFV